MHLYRSCPFENEVASFLDACSQEDLRHLLSQGIWLNELIQSTGSVLSDSRFNGAVPEADDDKAVYYVRFASSDSKLPESRTQKAWERLQAFSTFPGRLMYLRQIIFQGYLVEHAFSDKYGMVFSDLMSKPALESPTVAAVETKTKDVVVPKDLVQTKKASAKQKLGGLM